MVQFFLFCRNGSGVDRLGHGGDPVLSDGRRFYAVCLFFCLLVFGAARDHVLGGVLLGGKVHRTLNHPAGGPIEYAPGDAVFIAFGHRAGAAGMGFAHVVQYPYAGCLIDVH